MRTVRAPSRADIGKAVKGSPDADNVAKLRDLVVTQVPTELVAPYTAVSAAIVGAVATPTLENPNPNDYVWLRWALFVALVVFVVLVVAIRGRAKQTHGKDGKTRFPLAEVIGAGVAAIAWAFLLPASPLAAIIDDNVLRAILPAAVAFVAIGINFVIAEQLKASAA